MKKCKWLGLAVVLSLTTNVQAALLVEESFEYPSTGTNGLWSGTGNTGLNGGTGFASEWFVTDTTGTVGWNIETGTPIWGTLLTSSNWMYRADARGRE